MVGDIAAAARLENRYTKRFQSLRRRQDVRSAAITASAEGEDVRMLQQDELIGNAIVATICGKSLLQLKTVAVGNRSESSYFEESHFSLYRRLVEALYLLLDD